MNKERMARWLIASEPAIQFGPMSPAQSAFLTKKWEIDTLLAEISKHSDDHFGVMPEAVNFGHVGTLGALAETLKSVADQLAKRGEYADVG